MRNTVGCIAVVALASFGAIALADEWFRPTEKDYFSESERFVAHVTPRKALEKTPPVLEVSEIEGSQRTSLWRCTLGNKEAPVEVYPCDDGRHVITVNEHGALGFGDYVVAFYNETGVVKHYTIEEVLHLQQPLSASESEALLKKARDPNCTNEERTRIFRTLKERRSVDLLVPRSTSSRWWDQHSVKFIDAQGGKTCFCIWLHLFDRWAAWDSATGQELPVGETMTKRWNEKARQWSIKQIQSEKPGDAPYEFLGRMMNAEDRPLIEALLSDRSFGSGSTHSGTRVGRHLELYLAHSTNRMLAERLLARWDGKPMESGSSLSQPLYHLGRVEGVVTLPRTSDSNQATLWVWLIPVDVPKDRWRESPPVQRLIAPFSDYTLKGFDPEYMEKFPFGISTVTPGRYWVKAVLDKTKPLSQFFDQTFTPKPGDYDNVDSPVITVVAGKTENVSIDCTHKVTDGTD